MLKRCIIFSMKYFTRFFLFSFLFFAMIMVSCKSTESAQSQSSTPASMPVIESKETSGSNEAVQTKKPVDEKDSEYDKAVKRVSGETITVNTYEADLAAITKIITDLNAVMTQRNYDKWCSYVEPASITYWKNPSHLAKASARLPRKDVKVKNLFDYFNYVFIPSRVGYTVENIRYINSKSVKAVQVKENETEIVYYNFVKVNGKWMVQLPPLD